DEPDRARRRLARLSPGEFPAQGAAQRRPGGRISVPHRPAGISRLGAHPVRRTRRPRRQARGHCQAAGARGARRHLARRLAQVPRAREGAALLRPRRPQRARSAGADAMTAIAAVAAPRAKSRYLLDRPELVGPLFIAPAILYVLVLVAMPFCLAIY